jgi:hypothetical protein
MSLRSSAETSTVWRLAFKYCSASSSAVDQLTLSIITENNEQKKIILLSQKSPVQLTTLHVLRDSDGLILVKYNMKKVTAARLDVKETYES